MYVEKRKKGEDIKYYLSHSYFIEGKVRKFRSYLGMNLREGDIALRKMKAEKILNEKMDKFYSKKEVL